MLVLILLQFSASYSPSDSEIESLLANMSLAEKVGQMANIAIDNFVDPSTERVKPDYATLAIGQYYIGSLQNTFALIAHSRQTWAGIQRDLNNFSRLTPSKIPLLYGLDSIHGATFVSNSTLFPQEIGIAATFNTTIAYVGSQIAAYETRAASVAWTFAPVVDLGLDPRWSRIWEDFGEDPYLAGEMGAAMVRGFQGPDPDAVDAFHVLATAKHYLGYGNPVSGKDRTPAIIPEHLLREYHLPAFQKLIDADVATVMVNSGIVNGIPVHANRFLLTNVLKGELNFRGFVISDWQDIENVYSRDHVAKSSKDAIRLGILAGLDMAIVPYDLNFTTWLIELVQEGAVPLERVNDAVRRILRVKARAGLWQRPLTDSADYPNFGSVEHERAAYEAAAESITLLKNTNRVLPIPAGSRILVAGPNADSMRVLDGGWSYGWQGFAVDQFAAKYRTVLGAIRRVFGAANVLYSPGVRYASGADAKYWAEDDVGIEAAVKAAQDPAIDYVVLVLGENSYTEKPGDLQDLTLSDLQLRLAEEIAATGKRVVLVLSEGRPRLIERIVDRVHAVVLAYLPGNLGGDAIADILAGTVNPSGKLPYTYPRFPHGLVNYWHKPSEEAEFDPDDPRKSDWAPLFEFGFGLSYTAFAYRNLTLSRNVMTAADTLRVAVNVTNTGDRDGKEAVLLFTSDVYASLTPDVKRLRRFTKIALAKGETKTVSFDLRAEDLSFVNIENKRVTEPGEFTVLVGPLKASFRFK
jgi:beta-glucosidase